MSVHSEGGDCFVVEGGRPVTGSLAAAGNKNEALPALAATLLAGGESRLENVPKISDVFTLLEILTDLGVDAGTVASGDALRIDTGGLGDRPCGDARGLS